MPEPELAANRSAHAVPDLACNATPVLGSRVCRCVDSSGLQSPWRPNRNGWLEARHGARGLFRASAVAVFRPKAERFVLDSTTDPVPKQFLPLWVVGEVSFDELAH